MEVEWIRFKIYANGDVSSRRDAGCTVTPQGLFDSSGADMLQRLSIRVRGHVLQVVCCVYMPKPQRHCEPSLYFTALASAPGLRGHPRKSGTSSTRWRHIAPFPRDQRLGPEQGQRSSDELVKALGSHLVLLLLFDLFSVIPSPVSSGNACPKGCIGGPSLGPRSQIRRCSAIPQHLKSRAAACDWFLAARWKPTAQVCSYVGR